MELSLDYQGILEGRSNVLLTVELGAEGRSGRPGAGAYALVFDRSLSMDAEAFRRAQHAARLLIHHLPQNAELTVAAFDDEAEVILPLTDVVDKGAFKAMVSQIEPVDAGSNLSGAWLLAREELAAGKGAKRIILFTNGEPSSGASGEHWLEELAAAGTREAIRTSFFSCGPGNEKLLQKLAIAGGGGFHRNCRGAKLLAAVRDELDDLLPVVAQNGRLIVRRGDFCEGIEPLGSALFARQSGSITMELGDFVTGEVKSACFILEILRVPCIDGKPCMSLQGESLLEVELFYNAINSEGVVARGFRQPVLIQAAQPLAQSEDRHQAMVFSDKGNSKGYDPK